MTPTISEPPQTILSGSLIILGCLRNMLRDILRGRGSRTSKLMIDRESDGRQVDVSQRRTF
ncbi:hypothetical protein EEQ99_28880 [Rhizobium anhuiense]|uniref:Uncharacterized protein n=1 Tax=Rhizobium anhuiense TaxID=1184720 RepID=A0A3S0SNN7_9HYPH|nr:hypothetical protein EEQ99_28880 [Rhizobium anhuiense]